MPVIYQKHPLEYLSEGISRGLDTGMDLRRLKAMEEESKAHIARAERLVQIQEAQEGRAKRSEERYDRALEAENIIADERVGRITPEQTAPGFVKQGGMDQSMKAGLFAPSAFVAGLQQHHEKTLAHARNVLSKIPPEAKAAREDYLKSLESDLRRDTQTAMLDKASSDIENLGRDTATAEGGGAVEDMLGDGSKEGGGARARLGELKAILEAARDPNMDPNERQKLINTAMVGIGKQRDQLDEEEFRRERVAATVAEYKTQFATERAALAAARQTLRMPQEMYETLDARISAKERLLIAFKRNRDLDVKELLQGFEAADKITLPRPAAQTRQGRAPTEKAYTYSDALSDADRELGSEGTAETRRKRATELLKERQEPAKLAAIDEQLAQPEPSMDIPFVTEPGQPQPTQRAPAPNTIPFTKVKAPDRARLVAALRAAVLRGKPEEIDAIAAESGIDFETLPDVVKRQILMPSKEERENDKKDRARRDKLEKIGTNF